MCIYILYYFENCYTTIVLGWGGKCNTIAEILLIFRVGVRGIIGIPINRDAVWKRYVSRYGLVVSVHSGIFVSFRKSN